MPPAALAPIVHVALTVSDLDRSIDFYTALFGVGPVGRWVMLDGTAHRYEVAVWTTPNLGLHYFGEQPDGGFDERRPGLDHLAFACRSLGELHEWTERLDALGVAHGEVLNEPYGSGLAFRDPDNIALEFFVNARPVPESSL